MADALFHRPRTEHIPACRSHHSRTLGTVTLASHQRTLRAQDGCSRWRRQCRPSCCRLKRLARRSWTRGGSESTRIPCSRLMIRSCTVRTKELLADIAKSQRQAATKVGRLFHGPHVPVPEPKRLHPRPAAKDEMQCSDQSGPAQALRCPGRRFATRAAPGPVTVTVTDRDAARLGRTPPNEYT